MNRRLCMLALASVLSSALALLDSSPSVSAETAQKVVRVGFVDPASPSAVPRALAAFRERMRELGYIEGRNLIFELRWAEGRNDRLPALMDEVIARKIDVLVTFGTPASTAARNATTTVPIVAAVMGDPVGSGLAASLARPGGNITGLSAGYDELFIGKLLELMKEVLPKVSAIAVVRNPNNLATRRQAEALEVSAPQLGTKVIVIDMRDSTELEAAIDNAARRSKAVVFLADPLIRSNQRKIIALVAHHRLASIYTFPDFVEAGALMAYGPDFVALFRRAAEYVDKILRGARPADLPIEEPTRRVLSVNLKTAKALGIKIPESILLRADEVIR